MICFEFNARIMKTIKIIEFILRMMKNHENHRIPCDNHAKRMKILEYHTRIMKRMKILEFHASITKIMQILKFNERVMKIMKLIISQNNYENFRILFR